MISLILTRQISICVNSLAEKLCSAEKNGTLPKVLIPVHFAGHPCDMEAIWSLCNPYGIKIVEDASHAIGADMPSSKVGSCEFCDITVFSFHPVKIITTGEGGMAVTNCGEIHEKMKLFQSHGITRDRDLYENEVTDPWYYEQLTIGHNFRMNEIQAALGVSQLKRIDQFVACRNQLADRYRSFLKSLPLSLQKVSRGFRSADHLFVIRLDLNNISHLTRREIYESLQKKGIGVNVHYIPIHTHPFYQKLGFGWGDFPNSENYYRGAISIPLFPNLKLAEQDFVIESLHEILK